MAWHAATTALTSFSFYQDTDKQGLGFLETLKNATNLFKNNLNNTRNNMKSQIQKIKKQTNKQTKTKEWWNCSITNSNIKENY